MTWTKTGTEFPGDCAASELSDAAYRTHHEVIQWLYDREEYRCRISKQRAIKITESSTNESAMRELVAVGFWRDHGTEYEVIHQGNVIRQSLHQQHAKQDRDRRSQQAKRDRAKGNSVIDDVSADVSGDTDRQTDKQLGEADLNATQVSDCEHGVAWGCLVCKRERESA